MNEYESRLPEDFENELESLRERISTDPVHVWQIGSIDRQLFLIVCRISWLQASRSQCWAEARTLLRLITFKRTELFEKADEFSDEIERLLEIQVKLHDLKHEIMTRVNQRLHTGSW